LIGRASRAPICVFDGSVLAVTKASKTIV
jgi:hypothetical protein